jgi:TolA-binding protein
MACPTPPDATTPLASPSRPRPARGARLLLVAALLLPLAACATKRDVRDLGEVIRAQNAEQATRLAELRAEQGELERMIRSMNSTSDERHTEVLRRFRALENEIQVAQELAGASQASVAAIRDAIDRTPSRGGGGAGGFFEDDAASGDVAELYAEALTSHGRQSFAAARMGFTEIVERHPNHPLTPDARYYLADILAQEGETEEALRRFLRIPELHPDAARVPEALYRAGLIHRDRGEAEQARTLFTRIVNTWPDHEVAEMARAFLGGSRS